jgi:hypothetical protein
MNVEASHEKFPVDAPECCLTHAGEINNVKGCEKKVILFNHTQYNLS